MSIHFVHGQRYFFTIMDDYSKDTWIFLMNAKSQTRELLQNFIVKIKTQFNKTIKTVRYDNGPKFNFNALYNDHGIEH